LEFSFSRFFRGRRIVIHYNGNIRNSIILQCRSCSRILPSRYLLSANTTFVSIKKGNIITKNTLYLARGFWPGRIFNRIRRVFKEMTKKCLHHFSQHFISFWSGIFMERGYELKDQKIIYYWWWWDDQTFSFLNF
jgi:hypothetical protein